MRGEDERGASRATARRMVRGGREQGTSVSFGCRGARVGSASTVCLQHHPDVNAVKRDLSRSTILEREATSDQAVDLAAMIRSSRSGPDRVRGPGHGQAAPRDLEGGWWFWPSARSAMRVAEPERRGEGREREVADQSIVEHRQADPGPSRGAQPPRAGSRGVDLVGGHTALRGERGRVEIGRHVEESTVAGVGRAPGGVHRSPRRPLAGR